MTKRKAKNNLPVTQEQLREVAEELHSQIKDSEKSLRLDMQVLAGNIEKSLRHDMQVFAENIIDQITGAFRDETVTLREKVDNHEVRIAILEQK